MPNIYDNPLEDGPDYTAAYLEPLTKAAGRIGDVGFRPVQPARYIIFKEDSTYYRRDGVNGEVDDSSTTFATLANNAISDAAGDIVYFASGVYVVTAQIQWVADTHLIFSPLAKLYVTDNTLTSVLGPKTTSDSRATIENLYVSVDVATAALTSVVDFTDVDYCKLLRPRINFLKNAANCRAIDVNQALVTTIFDPYIYGSYGYYCKTAISIRGTLPSPNGTTIWHPRIVMPNGSTYGIEYLNGSSIEINSPIIDLYDPTAGIYVDTGTYFNIFNARIEQNAAGTTGDALHITVNAVSGRIWGGYIIGTWTNDVTNASTTTTFHHTPSYVTDNSGVTGAIATGTAVNHGLAATPTSVVATAAETGPTDIYVDTVGATSFKINFGGGGNKTFYWKAEVR